ncbi:threonine ammonia-lyase [Pedomonas sp. V897]|uniref:threonine ammonia-lyase n=1 Tax=Pedomonas sp. V897 TaxID=3446482 RepID=UPI003EDE7E27
MNRAVGGVEFCDGPGLADVRLAAGRLRGRVVRTPLIENPALNAAVGGRLFLKAETLQETGSFKLRGAFNRLLQLDDSQRRAGVAAFSSGNHAQGVARAAQALGIPAVIVMPADAPALKVARTQGYGAEVIFYDRTTESREEIAARLAAERGAVVVPSFDDPHIIAGQGTAGLEAAEDLAALGVAPDLFVSNCGGGGLASGCTLALRDAFPGIEVILVEPEHYDDAGRSLAAGERLSIAGYAPTLCDALQTPMIGALTFPILRAAGARGVAVSDAEVQRAVAFAFRELKLVVEPGGAAALAAVLAGKVPVAGRTAVLTLSGGNVDAETFARCLEA